jgi:NAD-dependent dihydropyrimidine dehydrogenase PreA subunit
MGMDISAIYLNPDFGTSSFHIAYFSCIQRVYALRLPMNIAMINIRRDVCSYCGACVSVCPQGSLELIDAYLTVDIETCKDKCKICSIVCPLGAIEWVVK